MKIIEFSKRVEEELKNIPSIPTITELIKSNPEIDDKCRIYDFLEEYPQYSIKDFMIPTTELSRDIHKFFENIPEEYRYIISYNWGIAIIQFLLIKDMSILIL